MKHSFSLLILFMPFMSIGQQKEEEIPQEFFDAFEEAFEKLGAGVHLTVDKKLYPSTFGGIYISDKPRATLMSKVKEGQLTKLAKTLPKASKKGGITTIDSGYLKHGKRNILYHIGYRVDSEGTKMKVDTYVYQATPSTLVYIIGTYLYGLTEYENATIHAAYTAKYVTPTK